MPTTMTRFIIHILPFLLVSSATDEATTHSLLRGGPSITEKRRMGVVSNVLGVVNDWLDVKVQQQGTVQTTPAEPNNNEQPLFKDPTQADMYGQPVSITPLKDEGKIAHIVGGSNALPEEAPWQVIFMFWNIAQSRWE